MVATFARTSATVSQGGTSDLQGFQAHHPRANLDCLESRSSPSLKGWLGVRVSMELLSGSIRIRSKC